MRRHPAPHATADFLPIPDNMLAAEKWENNEWRAAFLDRAETLARRYDGHLFLVSAGPLGKYLLSRMCA